MLGASSKALRVLKREGFSGLFNRIKYRHDKSLLRERPNRTGDQFILLGSGNFSSTLRGELIRKNLLATSDGPSIQYIMINPTKADLYREGIAVLVLDDDYLAGSDVAETPLYAQLASVPSVIVTSENALRRVMGMGAPIGNIMLVPFDGSEAAVRLSIGRWLVYIGAMNPEDYLTDFLALGAPINSRSRICISLPEYIERRRSFLDNGQPECHMFDGIRLLPGWKGAAWSYKIVATKALQSGARRLTICEDDALFGADFPAYFNAINRYLDRVDWDVFNGVMTRVAGQPEIMIKRRLGESNVIHTPHMMGMVFNVYNRPALEWIADWNPDAGGPDINTVDEWLNAMPGLKVVSAVPFLASHRDDVHSTIFGFKNTRYTGMISATEREMLALVGSS